ncbi:twitching motility protein PilT [Oscillochloris sp. ZM17-4]|uniref:PIN/TRAM domain-containing protein n=1 Tax=Oscillochloris sp. ZM17-4 TaxID=2866714 RepID=UPI001C72B3C5|nr:PIN domain-containing protein [Oscillochloris sp. ZM17-4]MBX0328955.1 twitching motility protein PilT [Oscillochloris sp. ZM17-4]
MKVSLNFLVRIAGMLVLAYIGWATGRSLSDPRPDDLQQFATQLLLLSGAGLGLLVTPRLTIEPVEELLRRSRSVPLSDLFLTGAGVMVGLIFSVLLTVPLSSLPAPLSHYLPALSAALFAYLGGTIFITRKRDILERMQGWRRAAPAITLNASESPTPGRRLILDTSAIIDGRIAVVAQTGFLEGTLIVPGFVLAELQQLADSSDDLRRAKGRRGLELLNGMQKQSALPIEVVNIEVSGATKVDDKLVAMARQYSSPIITNDFNLNRVAALQGVKVLSLNQLSESVRPPVTQDQRLHVMIRNEGNARQQGVGYLEDGTPVIVEEARHLIGQSVEVVVIRLHQTQTGRLVFAQLAES